VRRRDLDIDIPLGIDIEQIKIRHTGMGDGIAFRIDSHDFLKNEGRGPAGQAIGLEVIEDDLNAVFRDLLDRAAFAAASSQEETDESDRQDGPTPTILQKGLFP
jgi:hypothetical protein